MTQFDGLISILQFLFENVYSRWGFFFFFGMTGGWWCKRRNKKKKTTTKNASGADCCSDDDDLRPPFCPADNQMEETEQDGRFFFFERV